MFEAIESKVVKLVRVRIGNLTLDSPSAKWRDLSAAEVSLLKRNS